VSEPRAEHGTSAGEQPRGNPAVGRRRATAWLPKNAHPYAWWALAVTWAIWVLNAMDYAFVSVLSPVIVSEFGISSTALGAFVAGLLLLRVIADLPIAAWSDRLGSGWRRRTLWAPVIIFYAIVSALTAIKAISFNAWAFFALRGAVNIGSVACETIGISATSEWWAKTQRGFAVGLHHTGFPIGSFVAGQLTALVLAVFGNENWRYVFWFSLLSLPFVALYWWLSSPDKFEKVYRRMDENELERPYTAEETVRAEVPWWHVFKEKEVVLAAVYTAIFMSVFLMFAIAFPLYLAFVGGYSFAQVASYAVIWALTGALFQVLLPSFSDYVGRKPILVGAGLYAGVILLLLPYATNVYMVFGVQILYGVVLNAIYPICFSVCADASPPGRVATSISISTTFLWLAAAVATLATGWLIDLGGGVESQSGYLTVFYLMSGLSFAAGIMYLFARETAGTRHWRHQADPEEARGTPLP
jgi:MFS family permease